MNYTIYRNKEGNVVKRSTLKPGCLEIHATAEDVYAFMAHERDKMTRKYTKAATTRDVLIQNIWDVLVKGVPVSFLTDQVKPGVAIRRFNADEYPETKSN